MKIKFTLGITTILILNTIALAHSSTSTYSQEAAQKVLANMKKNAKSEGEFKKLLAGQIALPSYRLLAASSPMTGPKNPNPAAVCGDAFKNFVKADGSFVVGKQLTSFQKKVAVACGLDLVGKYNIGAVLTDANYTPFYATPSLKNWKFLVDLTKYYNKQVKIKGDKRLTLLLGTDAIHGNQHIAGSVIFPHNINLGMAHDPKIAEEVGKANAAATLESGFNWIYMPTVAVVHDYRWGRSYESYSQTPELVKKLAYYYIKGMQQIKDGKITGALATAKHFLGDGNTHYGHDEGNSLSQDRSIEKYWHDNGLGYEGAIESNAGSIMASYSAIDGKRMHFGGKWNILHKFNHGKGVPTGHGLAKFPGFVVSDYVAATRAAYFYSHTKNGVGKFTLEHAFEKSLRHGVDMLMLGRWNTKMPFIPIAGNDQRYYLTLGQAIQTIEKMPTDLLERAAQKIIAVKLAMNPTLETMSQPEQQSIALKAAEQSMVLLKNNHDLLPIPYDIQTIVLLGHATFDTENPLYNNIGAQNGGWTVTWQGQSGNEFFENKKSSTNPEGLLWGSSSGATTILKGIQKLAPNAMIVKGAEAAQKLSKYNSKHTVAIVVLSEVPYAEYMGDIANRHVFDPWYRVGSTYQAVEKDCKGSSCLSKVEPQNKYASTVKGKPVKYAFKYGGKSYTGFAYPQKSTLALNYTPEDLAAIQSLKAKGVKVITVVLSGRPVILDQGKDSPWKLSNSIIAAFLPGTLGGQSIANGIFGKYRFVGGYSNPNSLSFVWPKNMKGTRNLNDPNNPGIQKQLSFGLSTKTKPLGGLE